MKRRKRRLAKRRRARRRILRETFGPLIGALSALVNNANPLSDHFR